MLSFVLYSLCPKEGDYMSLIGDNIKRRREELGKTQVWLAEKTGESKQTIYKYETGIVSNIPLSKIEVIAKALSCDPGELSGWNGCTVKDSEQNNIILSPEEVDLVLRWREADDRQREDAAFVLLNKEEQRLIKLYRRADGIDRQTIWNILSRYDEEGSSTLGSTG